MKNSAILRVFGAIILAVSAGCFTGRDTAIFEINLLQLYGVVGQTFLNALKLIAVPLVSSSIIIATARMGSDSASQYCNRVLDKMDRWVKVISVRNN